jgi:uncharacterized protein
MAAKKSRPKFKAQKTAAYWIRKLQLEPHPEGGYYRQTYRADLLIEKNALPPQFSGPRPASTAIHFLLAGKDFSAFHRLQSDELWHFYLGGSLTVHVIEPAGRYFRIQLGNNPQAGEVFQAVVKAGCWFASEVKDRKSLALVGCTVAPGFDFEDFELADREQLQKSYPQHGKRIESLTRQ